jgi:hypothetical protein
MGETLGLRRDVGWLGAAIAASFAVDWLRWLLTERLALVGTTALNLLVGGAILGGWWFARTRQLRRGPDAAP